LYIDVLATKIGSLKKNSQQCNLIKEVIRETYNATNSERVKAIIGEIPLVDSPLLT
jgi:hypothetical protein